MSSTDSIGKILLLHLKRETPSGNTSTDPVQRKLSKKVSRTSKRRLKEIERHILTNYSMSEKLVLNPAAPTLIESLFDVSTLSAGYEATGGELSSGLSSAGTTGLAASVDIVNEVEVAPSAAAESACK